MPYTLNEYYQYANSAATRAEVYSDNTTAANLLALHKKNDAVELSLCDCVYASNILLPMPAELMSALDDKILSVQKRVIVTGIDAYLSLINAVDVRTFMAALKKRIDEEKLNAVYLLSKNRFDKTLFSNPKYENDLYIAYIFETHQQVSHPTVNVISDKWIKNENHPTDWSALLKALDKFEPTGIHTLVMKDFSSAQAGLSDNVLQMIEITDIAQQYYGIFADLPIATLEILISKCKDENISPTDYLRFKFENKNANERLAVKRLIQLRDDVLWTAYVWFLKNAINGNSYLAKVLTSTVTVENLLRLYVCDIAETLLSDANSEAYAKERAVGIREIGNVAASLIIEFIARINMKSNEIVACWLNCGTDAEHIEIIRRVAESDLSIGLPQIWHNLYPLLVDYLSDKYDYGNNEITAYFRDYRRMKIADAITEKFVKKAYDLMLPSSFILRDSILQDLSTRNETALLIVDGMGAEYFPLVCAMAERQGMNIESANVAAVRLPTSTEFNHINYWHKDKILDHIKEIDTISHYGAAKNEKCPPSRNIAATLDVFESVFNSIANGLTKFEKVVVTADHGSSRLAIIAHEEEMIETLEWNGEPLDWRFSIAPQNIKPPKEFESFYDLENNVTYWIVRGYNRLPKKGGKLSVHGGATLEERLVPVLVFTKNKTEIITKRVNEPKVEQIVEKMDFDI